MTQIIPFNSHFPLLAPSFFFPFPFLYVCSSFLSHSLSSFPHLLGYMLDIWLITYLHVHMLTHPQLHLYTQLHMYTHAHAHTHTHTALVRQPEIHCPMRLTTDLCLCSPLAVPPHCLIPHGLQVTWAVLSFRKSSLSSSPVWTAVPPRSSPRALAYLSQHCLHCTVLLFAHPLSTPRGAGGY